MTNQLSHNLSYQQRIELVLNHAIEQSPRLNVVRFDLYLPNYYQSIDTPKAVANNLISRFFASLKARLSSDAIQRRRLGHRVHDTKLYYVWAREFGELADKEHYHIAIFINKDRFHSLGSYDCNSGSLASLIIQAWASALDIPVDEAQSLVNFPDKACNWVESNSKSHSTQRGISVSRLNYLAKNKTKVYGTGKRNFGTSYIPKQY
ncbi:inovirus Gp2 family protein [Pseudoalteromonas carrageenovora]|uniref:inovirus Gp2 family protein n=1 Tax=Pseudoalteromonas carrageenovora TaxID=227 RepID=UPI0026E1E920|nr:inovirus Gp2 family protein [Pseudoalteromonas carrageenovora]MDO6465530.1 inovirus Gp2 family protein [Pseudoalteromonas carrageenovora]